ncbi:hypothetical protein HAX54_006858 [Datura stramonium]|uniref:Uncharacterized protein n=1 Tax=Datura stramonium TaxID=4076 RepID=A0ABS8TCI3_DATST|nr:hypothetical protein [Datura stramonium]
MVDPPQPPRAGHGDGNVNLELRLQTFMEVATKCMEQMEEMQPRNAESNQRMENLVMDIRRKEDSNGGNRSYLGALQGGSYTETVFLSALRLFISTAAPSGSSIVGLNASVNPPSFGTYIQPFSITETHTPPIGQIPRYHPLTPRPNFMPSFSVPYTHLPTTTQIPLYTTQARVITSRATDNSNHNLPTIFSHQDTTSHNLRFLKATLKFPEFDDKYVRGWTRRFEYYFDYYQVPDEAKMTYVVVSVKDKFDSWFDSYVIDHGGLIIGANFAMMFVNVMTEWGHSMWLLLLTVCSKHQIWITIKRNLRTFGLEFK